MDQKRSTRRYADTLQPKANAALRWFGGLLRTGRPCCAAVIAALLGVAASSAHAVGVTIPGTAILPGAVSFEYFGFNFAQNIATSSSVGVLSYSGHPGCGGVCTATTALGLAPSVDLHLSEVVFDYTGGGYAQALLDYYVTLLTPTPGSYPVVLYSHDVISVSPGAGGLAYLTFGTAGPTPSQINNFDQILFQETDCVSLGGCKTPSPFPATQPLMMVAGTEYLVQISVQINPTSDGVPSSAKIDPHFTTSAPGGHFVFSPGVLGGVPEPATWAMLLVGFAGLGVAIRYGRPENSLGGITARQ